MGFRPHFGPISSTEPSVGRYRVGVQIVPDTKDWTWVLDRVCDECGYDASAVNRPDVPSTVRGNAADWLQVLATPEVRRRPAPRVWSPLEYGCHVRDVFRIFDSLNWVPNMKVAMGVRPRMFMELFLERMEKLAKKIS